MIVYDVYLKNDTIKLIISICGLAEFLSANLKQEMQIW